MLKIKDNIEKISPYVPGKSGDKNNKEIIKFLG